MVFFFAVVLVRVVLVVLGVGVATTGSGAVVSWVASGVVSTVTTGSGVVSTVGVSTVVLLDAFNASIASRVDVVSL